MRVIFFGTPEFAVPSLQALLAAHDVAAVITRPDRPRGRGQKVTASPIKALADAHGAPVLQPTRLSDPDFLKQVAELKADIAVVAAYGRLLPQALLDVPPLGFVNVHASLLPRWRGAAPVHRAVLEGDPVTGVTIMRVVLALDAGPMLSTIATEIGPDETSEELELRLAEMGAGLLARTMPAIESRTVIEVTQDESKVTYAGKLERHESRIDWTRPAIELNRQVRGLQPWPLAAGLIDGRRVAFLRSAAVEGTSSSAPGTVIEAGSEGLTVACGTGFLRITEVLPEGRRAMSASAFLNGVAVKAGVQILPVPIPDRPS